MEENRCKFWLPRKNRSCANAPLNGSPFCGNHKPRSDSQWIPCPIDPSHSVLQENLEGHVKRCPLLKQTQSLSLQPYYQKGINAGKEEDNAITSEMKRIAVYSMTVSEFYELIKKIESIHATICDDISESYKIPEACNMWIKREVDSKLPFQEKHVKQQASIIGNLEYFGVINSSLVKEQCDVEGISLDKIDSRPAVVEFGAGRGYLTQMLADCYGIDRVFLVERKSYKLKADRSLRQKESLILERLRIDIEDLNLNAVESLRGVPFLAIGKHLCGPATDLTLRCCLSEQDSERSMEQCHDNDSLKGIAIATCCHHLCQWKHYANKKFMVDLGITKEEFHAITWFTSWAVDADHGSDLSVDSSLLLQSLEEEQHGGDVNGIEDVVRNMKAVERAVLGFMCKQIIDMGRMMWARERGLETQLVKYVPSSISPENHLLIAKHAKCS
ncbi:tRNA:m(4)X modification enzyme TRM13 homolog isoform X1 [Manihot esculenta]|uniref:tRNA:m(4)X modification enzyme TRM13 n=1 Tax=Manihot esculenta TaxID=3983 RepID=A0A2C9VS93_MANES|nr:tRNA:m(4)X modification enzyme TRM13 homolog isoform X1 [Manihot esculenta]